MYFRETSKIKTVDNEAEKKDLTFEMSRCLEYDLTLKQCTEVTLAPI